MSIRAGMRPMARPAMLAPVKLYCLDFTELTEVDPNDDITITTSKGAVDTMRRDSGAYVWGYYGANYFDEFEHRIDVEINAADNYGFTVAWMVSNEKGDVYDVYANGLGAIVLALLRYDPDGPKIQLEEYHGGPVRTLDDYVAEYDTTYYLVITRSGSTATCKIYSNAARTTLLDTLTVTLTGTSDASFRYLQTVSGKHTPLTAGEEITGFVENICRLEEAWPSPEAPPTVFSDDFSDNEIDLVKWAKYEVLNGTVAEQNERLECTCPGHVDISGLVSAEPWGLAGHTIEVDVLNDTTALQGMYICLTKVTNTRVWSEANFYRFIKDRRSNTWAIVRKVAGVFSTRGTGAWTGAGGSLKIVLSGGTIYFYEEDTLRHSEAYALASANVYIYLKCIGVTGYVGMDYFDNFVME